MDDKRALLGGLAIDREVVVASSRPWLPWATAIVGLMAGAAGMWLVLDRPAEETVATREAATPAPVPASALVSGPGERILNASGYVTARRIATVSAELTGRIVEVLVEEGMDVEEGQILARLDDALAQVDQRLAEAQTRASEAALASLAAQLAEARRVLARNRGLEEKNFVTRAEITRSESEVERLIADVARAGADLEAAQQQVARARERVADHVIRAPFAGVVTDKNAQPGEIVAPGSAGGGFTRTGICTLVDMTSLEIEVDVNEAFIGRVTEGQPVEARLDAYPDEVIPAHVLAIIPTANRDKATVKVRIGIDRPDPRILPDMGVNVAFLQTE